MFVDDDAGYVCHSFLCMFYIIMMCFSVFAWDKSNDVYYIFMWYLQFPGLQVNDNYFAACFDNGMLYVSSKIEVCCVGSWMASLGSVAAIVEVFLSFAFLFKVNVKVWLENVSKFSDLHFDCNSRSGTDVEQEKTPWSRFQSILALPIAVHGTLNRNTG